MRPSTDRREHQREIECGRDNAEAPSAELRESERRFREMIDALPAAVYTTDAAGRLTHFNPACINFSGRTPELGSDHWCVTWKLFYPDGRPMPHEECPMAIALKEGRILRGAEAIAERPDGTRIWFTPYPTLLFDDAGNIIGGVNMLVDITDRKRGEQALRESEERYRTLFNSMDEGYCIIEVIFDEHQKPVDYRFLEVNSAFEKQSGMHNVAGKRMLEFVSEIEDHWLANYGNVALTGEPVRFANVYKGLDRSFEVYAFRVGEPSSQRVAVLFTDITARRSDEQATARLAAIVTSSEDAIISKDLEGVITSWNKGAEHLFGYTAEEAIGRSVTLLIPEDHLDEEPKILERIRRGETVSHYETLRRRKDGSLVDISLTVSPMFDSAGGIIGASKVARDITEQRKMADKLKQNAADMTEADRRKNEFLAMLAHELRNPLAPIRNALQILRLGGNGDETVESLSEMMERQVGQMVRLVDDLLDVSRISRGKIELRMGRIELASAVNHALEAARALAQCAGQDLTVTLPREPIYLMADPTRLAQVIGNLLNNACKFTDQGGQISLAVETEDKWVLIRVRDTGVGIAAEKLAHIFEMFTQVDTTLERSQGGLGIGLTLVKNLVELHGGSVEARSEGIGQGSEFVVHLPMLEEVAMPGTSAPGPSAPTQSKGRRILVVDDNQDSAKSLALLLKLAGNETRTAYDGLEAVEAAEVFQPDVVLLDIGLPSLNGYEVAQRIREQPWGKSILLVALTGWGQDEDRQRTKEAGFSRHLVKPVDFATLTKLLADA